MMHFSLLTSTIHYLISARNIILNFDSGYFYNCFKILIVEKDWYYSIKIYEKKVLLVLDILKLYYC